MFVNIVFTCKQNILLNGVYIPIPLFVYVIYTHYPASRKVSIDYLSFF